MPAKDRSKNEPEPLADSYWEERIGGETEASWQEDRERKVGIFDEFVKEITACSKALRRIGALTRCTPEALGVPFAADWYVSLAGFALKTLGNLRSRAEKCGFKSNPAGFVGRVRKNPSFVDPGEAAAFSKWINSELEENFPASGSDEEALARVAMTLGGRAVGKGQNLGGEEARDALKRVLLEELSRLRPVRGSAGKKTFDLNAGAPARSIAEARSISFADKIVFDFTGGGDAPDVRAFLATDPDDALLVGEVKGRKDLSNQWESWMPQVVDHMTTWSKKYPSARRVFFGTIITREAVLGVSKKGTSRGGFKRLHKDRLLDDVFNLTFLADAESRHRKTFAAWIKSVVAGL